MRPAHESMPNHGYLKRPLLFHEGLRRSGSENPQKRDLDRESLLNISIEMIA